MNWRSRWSSDSYPAHAPVPPPPHPTYNLEQVVAAALEEDLAGIGDVTSSSTVPHDQQGLGVFKAKANGVVAGLAVVDEVLRQVDDSLQVRWRSHDGDRVRAGDVLGEVRGPARSLLTAERTALNFLQRMSGIASATAAMVLEVLPHPAKVLETRKTVPGLRLLDKWAVLVGGGGLHRVGLFDMAMIKNNHIAAAGGLRPALQSCRAYLKEKGLTVPIEVEVRSLEEVREMAEALDGDRATSDAEAEALPVTRVMLDNMARLSPDHPGGVDVTMMEEALKLLAGRVPTEASGNVALATIKAIAATGVDYVSCGALTHSVTALDISLHLT